nr:hypothetical protein [Tanacetum cinerariifolium]
MNEDKVDKHRSFTVNLKHDGIFSPHPFSYINGDEKQITDINFEGISYADLRELVRNLVHAPIFSLYYCKVGKTSAHRLCNLKNDADVQKFLKVGYESKWVVDLYTEQFGYDAMDYKNSNGMDYESGDSSDAYCSSDEEAIDYVDFFHKGEENVAIKSITTNDLFLTKLCSNHGHFRGFINEPIPNSDDVHMEGPDLSTLEPKHKVQRANYEVVGGYQLWYEKNDWRQLLVFCGKDVTTGRKGQVTFKLNKVKTKSNKKNYGEGTSSDGEGSSRHYETPLASGIIKEKTVSPKWTKSNLSADKQPKGKPICEFRLWASWMGSENPFQIKSLKAEHMCARNYNLSSLVTNKWIAHQIKKEIIAEPFITLLKMKVAIREKFLINVSLGQYTNPGSTCILEEEVIEHGNKYFHKMYICFKGVAYGWKAGCRRVIGLDGCFLKHTCKGELLTTVGRDANNQMYPIAWAVVRVGNNPNWSWFLSLLQEDLQLVSQKKWFEAYQFSIKPVYGSNMWKKQNKQPLFLPIIRRMPGRQKKNRIKAPGESNTQVSRVGRQMTCNNCYEKGHNKRARDKELVPKPPKVKKQHEIRMEPDFSHYASNKRGRRGSRGGTVGGRGETNDVKGVQEELAKVGEKGGRGRNGSRRAVRVGRGRGRGENSSTSLRLVDEQPGWRLTVEELVEEAHTTPNGKGKEADTSATPEPS